MLRPFGYAVQSIRVLERPLNSDLRHDTPLNCAVWNREQQVSMFPAEPIVAKKRNMDKQLVCTPALHQCIN